MSDYKNEAFNGVCPKAVYCELLGTEGQGDSFDAIYNYPICIMTDAERRQYCPIYLMREDEEQFQREWDLRMEEWAEDLVASMGAVDVSPMSDEELDKFLSSLDDVIPETPKRGERS